MFENRISSLQGLLAEHGVDALLISSPYNIAYLTGIHAFSIEEREAFILLTADNAYLFTDARYTEMVKDLEFITLCEISYKNPFSKQLENILKEKNFKSLGFEEEHISYKEVADLEEKVNFVDFVPTCDIVEVGRTIKDNLEVEKARKASHLTDKGFDFILKFLKEGVTELEIKAQLENFMRLSGGDLSFASIIAFGANSAIPHHLSGNKNLAKNDIILLDFGAKVEGYCSDMTRTVFSGEVNLELKKIYTATLEAQQIALDYVTTHMHKEFDIKKATELSNSHLRSMGFTDIPHGLGHGVGLQVHEAPRLSPFSDDILSPGMIVTVEPGIYIPHLGGVRIEDTILITPNGYETLTHSPKELTVL